MIKFLLGMWKEEAVDNTSLENQVYLALVAVTLLHPPCQDNAEGLVGNYGGEGDFQNSYVGGRGSPVVGFSRVSREDIKLTATVLQVRGDHGGGLFLLELSDNRYKLCPLPSANSLFGE